MGKDLIQRLLPILEKISWPEGTAVTAFGIETYQMGLDWVDQYTGNLKILDTAIKTFRSGDSRPYALAGIAYLFTKVAEERNGTYDADGLRLALEWLEQAQEHEPDRPDINFIEALVYILQGELENARLVLDYLREQDPYSYRINVTEALYWRALGELQTMSEWFDEAVQQADTTPKRLQLQSIQADAYYAAGNLERALKHYDQAIYFNREEATLWHKKSLIYWKLEDYEACKRSNDMTLKLRELPSALRLQEELRKKLGTGNLFQRLRGKE